MFSAERVRTTKTWCESVSQLPFKISRHPRPDILKMENLSQRQLRWSSIIHSAPEILKSWQFLSSSGSSVSGGFQIRAQVNWDVFQFLFVYANNRYLILEYVLRLEFANE